MANHLSQSPLGRIALHVLCVVRGGQCRCHWQGIRRELKPQVLLFLAGVTGVIVSAIALILHF